MKILELKIQGYRSLKQITWRPGDLNLIIGPNGSGKSNLLKALEMLSASAWGRLSKQILREGGIGSIVHDGKYPEVNFTLRAEKVDNLTPEVSPGQNNQYLLTLTRVGKTSSYECTREQLTEGDEDRSPLLIRSGKQIEVAGQQQRSSRDLERISQEETLLSYMTAPFSQNDAVLPFSDFLKNWMIYQDFQTGPDSPIRQAAIARYEQQVSANGDNLNQVLHTLYTNNRQFREDINQGMRVAFNGDFEELIFPPAADQRIQLRVGWKNLSQSQPSADLSDGTLRYLYLITILANPTPPALIAIDEPETGLHPSMLPMVAEYARNAAIRSQVMLTTHSAELLDAFSEFKPTITTTRWEEGQSVFQVVSKDSLTYWLQNYTLGNLYRTGELEDME